MARGRSQETAAGLPWLDAEQAFFIAVNRLLGDDVALALDYRADPRIVGSYVSTNPCCMSGEPWPLLSLPSTLLWIFRAPKKHGNHRRA